MSRANGRRGVARCLPVAIAKVPGNSLHSVLLMLFFLTKLTQFDRAGCINWTSYAGSASTADTCHVWRRHWYQSAELDLGAAVLSKVFGPMISVICGRDSPRFL
jgi:hypothetical protein